jgi:hypothetical protein
MAGGVEGLTAEQRALARSVCQRWVEHGLTLRPANRVTAEAGVGLVYREAGLPPPRRVLWAGSPLAGAVAALALTARSDPDLPDVPQAWERSWAELASQTAMPAGDPVWAPLRHDQVGAPVWSRLREPVWDAWWAAWAQAGDAVWEEVAAHAAAVDARVGAAGEAIWQQVRAQIVEWEWRWDHERWPRLLARVARGAWLPPWELVVVPPRTGGDGWEEWRGGGGGPERRSSGS